MPVADHNRIIATAAKSVLGPMGCEQKGRSRLWLDDHGWWVGIVEFQPSARSKGSYLNVGASWLWTQHDYWSFDDGATPSGSRVEAFHKYQSPEKFGSIAASLAETAKAELTRLRERHRSIEATAGYLCGRAASNVWDHFHAAVAAALVGDTRMSRTRFRAVASERLEFPWVTQLRRQAVQLEELIDEPAQYREAVTDLVGRTRDLRKLPKIMASRLFVP